MPFSVLHYPVGYGMYKASKQRLSLPGLIVGSLAPDLETPFLYYATGTVVYNRLVLHSLLGALTVGLLISVVITVLIYPKIVGLFVKSRAKLSKETRASPRLFLSCALGLSAHVLLDLTCHIYNPVFWPFHPGVFLPYSLFLTGVAVVYTLMGIALLIILVRNRGRGIWEKLLIG